MITIKGMKKYFGGRKIQFSVSFISQSILINFNLNVMLIIFTFLNLILIIFTLYTHKHTHMHIDHYTVRRKAFLSKGLTFL